MATFAETIDRMKTEQIAELQAQITNQGQIIEQLARIIREYKTSSEMGVEAIRAQAEEIEQLKAALDKISKTAVTLGRPESAWEQWRICAGTANKALGRG